MFITVLPLVTLAFAALWIVNRSTLETIGSFGDGGRLPGHFYGVGSIATDSKGNIYTGETYEGKRVQKFMKK